MRLIGLFEVGLSWMGVLPVPLFAVICPPRCVIDALQAGFGGLCALTGGNERRKGEMARFYRYIRYCQK